MGHVHITGAFKTAQAVHDTLQKAHPQLSSDKIKSMITSELGCVTPQILDDGVYTELELQHVCQNITFGKKYGGGCNCLSAQVSTLDLFFAFTSSGSTELVKTGWKNTLWGLPILILSVELLTQPYVNQSDIIIT